MKICYRKSVTKSDWFRFVCQVFSLVIYRVFWDSSKNPNFYEINLYSCNHMIIKKNNWCFVISQDINSGRRYYTYDYSKITKSKKQLALHLGFKANALVLQRISEQACITSRCNNGCTHFMLDLNSVPQTEDCKHRGFSVEAHILEKPIDNQLLMK